MGSIICLQTRPRVIYTKKLWTGLVWCCLQISPGWFGFRVHRVWWVLLLLMRQLGIAYIPSPCHTGTLFMQTILEIIFDLWKIMKKFAINNTGKRSRIPPTPAKRLCSTRQHAFQRSASLIAPLINNWAQIAPKNIINQPGNREVEGRLERKIGAGINFIATLKMIIFPTTPYLASRSICVRFEEQIHIADRNWKKN